MDNNTTQHNNKNAQNPASRTVMDVIYYLLSNWKWFVAALVLSTALAWLYYARSPRIYFASATVIIKGPSNKTTSAGFDRYDNYINRVNVANEILQFQSAALMREVVQRLHADIDYSVEESLHTRELYKDSPHTRRFHRRRPPIGHQAQRDPDIRRRMPRRSGQGR